MLGEMVAYCQLLQRSVGTPPFHATLNWKIRSKKNSKYFLPDPTSETKQTMIPSSILPFWTVLLCDRCWPTLSRIYPDFMEARPRHLSSKVHTWSIPVTWWCLIGQAWREFGTYSNLFVNLFNFQESSQKVTSTQSMRILTARWPGLALVLVWCPLLPLTH